MEPVLLCSAFLHVGTSVSGRLVALRLDHLKFLRLVSSLGCPLRPGLGRPIWFDYHDVGVQTEGRSLFAPSSPVRRWKPSPRRSRFQNPDDEGRWNRLRLRTAMLHFATAQPSPRRRCEHWAAAPGTLLGVLAVSGLEGVHGVPRARLVAEDVD